MAHNPPIEERRAHTPRESQGLRFGLIVGLTLAFILLSFLLAMGQTAADEPAVIDAARRSAVVDSLATLLDNCYVFADVGRNMAEAIRANLREKKYDGMTDPGEFARALNQDILEISNDRHLRVGYSPERVAMITAEEDTTTEEEARRQQLAEARANNFAFKKVERLQGNIGYVRLDGFSGMPEAAGTARGAMMFLENVDALIFDVRYNGGGSPLMIQYLSSYLFDGEPRHLNTFYLRENDSLEHFFTYPHILGGRLTEIPVYVLTSNRTFSAAEEFTYNLKHMGRATIIGDTTGGGAHPVNGFAIDDGFAANISIGRAINPVTRTNWEGVGIIPHIAVDTETALEAAQLDAIQTILARGVDEDHAGLLDWQKTGLEAMLNPFELSSEQMQPYIGVYGPRAITLEDGELYYQREDRPRYRMIPMAADLFRFDELEYFRLKFERDATGIVTAVIGLYDSGFSDRHERGASSQ